MKSNTKEYPTGRAITRIHKGYSAGDFDMSQPEWEKLDRIHTEVIMGIDQSDKELEFVKKLLKRAYDSQRII